MKKLIQANLSLNGVLNNAGAMSGQQMFQNVVGTD
jgi:hypothetical protein